MEQAKQKANRLRFLHRVAFICNILFVVCLIMRYTHAEAFIPQPIIELATLLGWMFSPFINLVCITLSLVAVLKKGSGLNIRLWLIALNVFFFCFEIFFFFIYD